MPIEQLIPLILLTTLLFSVYTLCKVIRLHYRIKIPNKRKKYVLYEKSDIFSIVRGYFGLVLVWALYLSGRFMYVH
jgi:hypothetical protein